MSWYRTGKINLTNGSRDVVGVGTDFVQNISPGFALLAPDGKLYEIASVTAAAAVRLADPYQGADAVDASYAVLQMTGFVQQLSTAVTDLISRYGEVLLAFESGELVGSGLQLKGVLNSEADLPATPALGDAYLIGTSLYVFAGVTGWKSQNIAGVTPKGAWAAETAYAVNDLVNYAGAQYRRKVAGMSANAPSLDAANWGLFVDRGATGPAGVTPRGPWDAGLAYAINDLVAYGGSQYRRKSAGTTPGDPAADDANWELFVKKGQDGTGSVVSVNGAGPDGAGNVVVPIPVRSVAGKTGDGTGNVVLDVADVSGAAPLSRVGDAGSVAFRNRIINGDMRIAQRSAGAIAAGQSGYPADRHLFVSSLGTVNIARSASAPPGFFGSSSMSVSAAATASAGQYIQLQHKIEGLNVADLGFGTASASQCVLAFWVNSSVVGNYYVGIRNSALTRSFIVKYTINQANTWERKVMVIPGCTDGTWLLDNNTGFIVTWDLGSGSDFQGAAGAWQNGLASCGADRANWIGTAGASFLLTGLQLEPGSIATPFERRPYGVELGLCERYTRVANIEQRVYGAGAGATYSAPYPFPTMRATPTATQIAAGSTINASSATLSMYTSSLGLSTLVPAAAGDCYVTARSYLLTAEL
jgi:hypothetical protein